MCRYRGDGSKRLGYDDSLTSSWLEDKLLMKATSYNLNILTRLTGLLFQYNSHPFSNLFFNEITLFSCISLPACFHCRSLWLPVSGHGI
ncbi:hypothetical protein I7I48_10096 [Histoplasma ohiense]|nr:hypothetical protein I7I48_10096 [Histoplasma ohiense (nom. inval.)]